MPASNTNIFNFLERMKMLSAITRFGTLPFRNKESVSEHSFNVAFIAMLISDHEPELKANNELILRRALMHDFPETITSDIPYQIKHRYSDGKLAEALNEIENDLIENEIFDELPTNIKVRYIEISKMSKDTLESKIVKAADAIDVVLTAMKEINLGNKYFDHVYEIGMKLLAGYSDLKFVKAFVRGVDKYKKGGNPHIDMQE